MKLIVLLKVLCVALALSVSAVHAETWQSPLLQDHPLAGSIVEVKTGKLISEQRLLEKLQEIDHVLIGEKHDNPDHHVIEQRLLENLIHADRRRVIFEMLDDNQQDRVAQLSAEDSLDQMKTKLQWPERGWDWQSYGLLFKTVLEKGGEIITGNVARDSLRQMYRADIADLQAEPRYRSLDVLSADERNTIQQQVYESHCEMMPFDSLAPMVTVQLAKDASMADAMVGSDKTKTGSILVAGGFHVSKLLGVPRHLEKLAPASSFAVVMLYEVEEGLNQSLDYLQGEFQEDAAMADFIWFTPKATNKDYCESLRSHGKSS